MVKFKEAGKRMFNNVFVCKKCKKKIRSTAQKVLKKEVSCKNCGNKEYRPIRKLKVVGK